MNNEHELNKIVFLVEPELLQETFDLLQNLPYNTVFPVINKLLELRSVPMKGYTVYEVKNEQTAEKETN